MVEKNQLFIFSALILIAILSLCITSAASAQVKISAPPGNEVMTRILDINTGKTLDGGYFYQNVDASGSVFLEYSSPEPIVYISVLVKKNGETINSEIFKNVIFDGLITVDMNQNPPTIVIPAEVAETEEVLVPETSENDTEPETTQEQTTEEAETNNSSGMTGLAVLKNESPVFKIPYYVFIIVVVAGGILFFVLKSGLLKRKHANSDENYVIKKLPQKEERKFTSNQDGVMDAEKRLAAAEQKLKEAYQEINEIKSKKSRVSEAENKFRQARAELERARREEGLL